MRDVLRLALDCLLVGLAAGTALMMALVLFGPAALRAAAERGGSGLLAVLMVAVFAGAAIGGLRFGVMLVRRDLREDREDALRRKFLIPAQRRRRQ